MSPEEAEFWRLLGYVVTVLATTEHAKVAKDFETAARKVFDGPGRLG